jgi:hypothetical protein
VAAILCRRPRDDYGIDSPLAQDNVKVRAKKAAVAMLLDHMVYAQAGPDCSGPQRDVSFLPEP